MAVSNESELLTALAERRHTDVTGTPESSWVDFKKGPYAPSDRGHWELCKDVAAFANAEGGCLVLGFDEVMEPTLGVAVAGAFHPIPVSLVDLTKYRDVIERWVYPAPSRIEMKWFADGTPPFGVLVIRVSAVKDEQPHVLRRLVEVTGKPTEAAVGIPKRNADRTNWALAERVHHLLRQASASDDSGNTPSPSVPLALDGAKQRIRILQDWTDQPLVWLHAEPMGGAQMLPHFYDEVRNAFDRPASIRAGGFGLGTLGSVEVVEGSLVAHRNDAAGWLSPDGTFTVGLVAAKTSLLGWAVNRSLVYERRTLLNSMTLVEFTFEFVRFVYGVLQPRAQAQQWQFVVGSEGLRSADVQLPKGPAIQLPPSFAPTASADAWSQTTTGTDDPPADAFILLTRFYGLFGLAEGDIPYSAEGRVDGGRLKP